MRFGDTSGAIGEARELQRLKGLPGGSPKMVYLGLKDDHRTAVFLVAAGVTVQGDGHCDPTPDNCQTLRMKAGDTVFLTVPQGSGAAKQYEVDLVKVVTRSTHSAAAAAKAHSAEAKGGRALLRENLGRLGRYRYDRATGTVRVIGAKAWAASVAKASAAAARAKAAAAG